MNGIEKITKRIEAQAQAEIDRILADAKERADEIHAQAEAQAEAERVALTARNEKVAAEREERLVGAAQMEAKKIVLAARQEQLEKAYAKALETLCSMPDEQYTKTLAALLEQAAPDGKGSVIFAPDVKERIGAATVALANEKLKGSLTLAEETRPMQGGFILSKGNVEVNCTFETLVRLQKAETAGAVLKKLFP
jgi:V/A-type H+-transporting ATPase subunit E